MKAELTIKKMKRELFKVYRNQDLKKSVRKAAWDMATALEWTINNYTTWTPLAIINHEGIK